MSSEYNMVKDLMTDVIPEMMKIIVLTPFTEESAKQISSAVVFFYNELKNKGLSKAFAERLTEVYLGAFRQPPNLPQTSNK